ncbi:MAG: prolyl oligopeptidase family serine peptidase [Bacteroidales bacterium]|jgi:dipeptidyl aminopeptidase/acylaminoacyl peptidase|nr:prolyl oligopeptidase family serine peptidase [Bacteroidales bacterium]
MRKLFICLITLFSYFYGIGQQEVIVQKYLYAGNIPLSKPILSDSVNANGKAFEESNLLKSKIAHDKLLSEATIMQADTSGELIFEASRDIYSLHLFSFYLNADRFTKGNLTISGSGMFEVYVDKEMKKDTQKADTMTSVKIDLKLEPRRYQVVVKYLALPERQKALTIKSVFKTEDEKSVITATADPSKRYTVMDMLNGKHIRSALISPNGKYALISYNERTEKRTETYKQLIETETGKIILQEKGYLNSASWTPTSSTLYFTRTGLNERELVTLDPESLQEQVLADNLPDGNFSFTPDEKTLIFSIKEEGPKEIKSMIRIVDPSDRQSGWRNRYTLARYSLETGLLEQLTYGYRNTSLNDISPDSRHLLFSISDYEYTSRPFSTKSLYLLDLQTLKIDTLLTNAPHVNYCAFSSDGKQLLVNGAPDAFDGVGLNIGVEKIANAYDGQLFLFDIEKKEVNPLTKEFNPAIKTAFWNKNDKKIYILAEDGDRQKIYLLSPENLKTVSVDVPEDMIKSISVAQQASALVCYGQSGSNADRLYYVNAKNLKSKCLYDLSAERLKDIVLGEMYDWTFVSADETEITGRYYLPPDFDASKKYPLLVYYYGGTNPTSRNLEFSYSMHLFAAQGYVVYTLTPSGSTGFGQEFSARHVNAWGKRTADEIISGTKQFCKEHDFIDVFKIGCFGASYGGFMTQYLQTQTDIFAAAISHAGISALSSYWGEGYWGIGYCSIANADSYPWNNKELFVEQSPLFNADKINTPLLLLHGNADTNVPVGESVQMYNALRILGKPVELIQVEGENHGIVDYHKKITWTHTMMAWFAKWLKEEPEWWNELYPERNL